jgi:predicted dehydrogenase
MKFLVIGLGSAGQRHLRVLNKFFGRNANIYVYRGNHKRGLISEDLNSENFSINPVKYYNAIEIYTIVEIVEKTWDLVIIATPPNYHYFYIEKIIASSKRILIEKPLTVNATEALRVMNLAQINNVPILVGYQMTFHPFKVFIKNNINEIGEVKSCSTVFNEDLSLMNPFRSMESHYLSKSTGGGVFLSLSHDLDFLLTIFNQTFADDIFFTNTKFSNNGSLVECNLRCTIWLESNKLNVSSKFSILPGPTVRTGQIQGLRAGIEWDFSSGIIKLKGHTGKTENILNCLADKDELFRSQIENILNLENYNEYCQNNLSRARFIVEANTKMNNE